MSRTLSLRNRGTYAPEIEAELDYLAQQMGAYLEQLDAQVPVGAQVGYVGATAPNGWMFSDGSTLLRARFPDLFKVIGTTYGGNSTTTFNLPTESDQIIYTGVKL